ncbi:MAG: TlpA disulfide reductase family protein [Saprospiraceae bacterium]|nr:TlpA family protein disulfide reductase [Lewinella sp.]
MKVLSILSLAFFLTFGIMAYGQNTLPSITLKTLDGQDVNLTSYTGNGKVIIISMWATWCAPCKKELDALADLYDSWQDKYQIELLAVTIDTQRQFAKVKPMVESKGWPFTILSDANNQLMERMGVLSIPHTFVVSNTGEIVYSHIGYAPGDEIELEDKLKSLVGQ